MRLIQVDQLELAEPRVRVLWKGTASDCQFEPPLFVSGSAAQEFAEQHRQSFTNAAPALYAITDAQVHGVGCVSWDECVVGGAGWPGLSTLTQAGPRLFGQSAAEYFQKTARTTKRRRVDDVAVLLARPGDNIYGHWLIDILPIVWLATRSGLRPKFILREGTPCTRCSGCKRRDNPSPHLCFTILKPRHWTSNPWSFRQDYEGEIACTRKSANIVTGCKLLPAVKILPTLQVIDVYTFRAALGPLLIGNCSIARR